MACRLKEYITELSKQVDPEVAKQLQGLIGKEPKMEIRDEKTAPKSEGANVETKAGAGFGSNSKIKDTVYHYAQSGTIDPTLKTNSKEKALFFFKNRKSAELLQEAFNQGKPDKTGKIFEAKINLVNPREVDATDHDTGRLINETIDADKSGNDGIIAHNMTEFFVGVDDQYGVFDIEKNVQFLNLEEKQTNDNSDIKKVDLTEQNYKETNDNRTVQMNAMRVREKIMADNEHWKLYTKDKTYTRGKYDKYYGALREVINKFTKPTTVSVPGLILKSMVTSKLNEITVANYNYETHTIGIATTPTAEEMDNAIEDGLISKYMMDNSIIPEDIIKNSKDIIKYVEDNKANVLENVLKVVAGVKGGHAVTHELIHAGALNYMRANPEAEATLRINELYQEALANKDKIQRLAYSGDVFSTYWEKNVEEFLAEAMSNPGLMYALSQTKTDGKKKLSKGMLRELVDTLLDMLGLSPKVKDNILEYVMDGFAAIIEAQADKVPVGLEIDSETKAMLMAKLNELKEQNGTIHLEDRAASEKADIERLKDC